MSRNYGGKKSIRVVYFDAPPTGDLKQRMHNPKVGVVMLSQAKMQKCDIPGISETATAINMKILDNVWIMKICCQVRYYDVTSNSRWRTAAILTIVISPCLRKKSYNLNEILYRAADFEPNDSHMIKN